MKVYFVGSVQDNQTDLDNFTRIARHLMHEHTVMTEYAVHKVEGNQLTDNQVRARDISWLRDSDIVVAETSNPSLGVGYELAYAEKIDKPVIILHKTTGIRLSKIIAGTEFFDIVIEYVDVKDAIHQLDQQLDQFHL